MQGVSSVEGTLFVLNVCENFWRRKMKRKLLFMLTLTLVVACAVGLAACGDDNSDEHKLTHVVAVDATCTEDGNIRKRYESNQRVY